MANFIINGDIYLKIRPEIFISDDRLDDDINRLEFEISKEDPNFQFLPFLEMYKEIKNINGQLDDSGTDAFWQLFTDGKYFELVNCNEMSLIDPEIYTSFDKLNGNFIRLSDFLKFSVFVGKEFKRTKPIKYENGWEDNSYCRKYDDTKYIVLYATRDLFLIKYESRYKDEYALITSKYTLDENYVFFGPVYEKYRDTKRVYSEIFAQVSAVTQEKMKK